MGLLDRLIERFGGARASGRGASLEARGRLVEAYEFYRASGQGEQAARVMIARAEAEPDPPVRLALLALAASCAPDSGVGRQARERKALLAFDLVRARPGSMLESELAVLARELESAGLNRQAAEVFGSLGDRDNQARLLATSGAIEDLESVLATDRDDRAARRERQQLWDEASDMIAVGQRLRAAQICDDWLLDHPTDDDVRTLARNAIDRLVPGPCVFARLGQQLVTIALGDEAFVGRSDSTIVLPSPVLSRRHLLFKRGPQGPLVCDLQSRNGTLLAGARLDGPIEIGEGLQLSLGGQITCRIDPTSDGALRLLIADQTWLLPLGPMKIGPFRMVAAERCVQVHQGQGVTPPVLNGLLANVPIDLCRGDKIRENRQGPVLLEVMGS